MKRYRFIFLLFFVLAIAGCGGSGGSGGGDGDTAGLCFTSSGSTVVSIKINGTLDNIPALDYSKDGLNWSPIALVNDSTVEVTALSDGEKVYLRARNTNNSFSESVYNYIHFVLTGSGTIAASGNIMSLLDTTLSSTEIPCAKCFFRLFYNCTALTRAPILPAVTLTSGCYQNMFEGCTNLKTAPVLPALTLKSQCYDSMFCYCTNLMTAPALPAVTLTDGCYKSMFNGCTNLMTAPALPAVTLTDGCYQSMFNGCTNLMTAPELPASSLAASCYGGMFQDCTSLITAPELPAITLTYRCYNRMFYGCTGLTTAPELPATTLADYCYKDMFTNCLNLNNITVCFTKWTDASWTDATKDWVVGVPTGGTFICPAALVTPYPDFGEDRIPTGWAVNP